MTAERAPPAPTSLPGPWQKALRDLVEERIGVRLRVDEPLSALQQFVAARLQALSLGSPQSYVNYLRSEPADGSGTEFVRLTAACTNSQTSFFRDPDQWQSMLRAAAEIHRSTKRPLRIWSAACSTGEEPYTFAMLLQDAGVPGSILATDINADSLRVAALGLYGEWPLRHVPAQLHARMFKQEGHQWRLSPEVRALVTFKRHNLVDAALPVPELGAWDIILCRNVFIYFAAATVERIVHAMARLLAPHGWLFPAAPESFSGLSVPLVPSTIKSRVGYRHGPRPTPAATTSPTLRAATPSPPVELAVARLKEDPNSGSARRLLVERLALQPQDVLNWLSLGHIDLGVHRFEEALDAYIHAQGIEPLLAETHYFQGVVHRKVGDLDLAEQALRRALFLDPGYWPASYLLAGIYDRQNRPSLSRRELLQTRQHVQNAVAPPFRSRIDHGTALYLEPRDVLAACEARLEPREVS